MRRGLPFSGGWAALGSSSPRPLGFEEFVALQNGVEEMVLAFDDDVVDGQAALFVAALQEFGEVDAAALDDFD